MGVVITVAGKIFNKKPWWKPGPNYNAHEKKNYC